MLADNNVLSFVDSLFNEARLNDELPAVRTPQEGYGIMAERFLSVASSTTGTKKAVADALEAMSEGDRNTFINTCDRVYSASVQVADAAFKMAAAMQNVVTQLSMYEGQSATITPLESLANNDNDDDPDNEEE